MSYYPKVNKRNWRSLKKANKKTFKYIMRELHNRILDQIATIQRLHNTSIGSEYLSIPIEDTYIHISLEWKQL